MDHAPAGVARTAPARGRSRPLDRRRAWALIFLTPWAIGFTVLFLYPLASTLWFSLTNYNGLSTAEFVGLRNYVYMFTSDPVVRTAAANTLWLVVVLTVLRVAFGLGVAWPACWPGSPAGPG
jgi:multiple sugar transport system permease protein